MPRCEVGGLQEGKKEQEKRLNSKTTKKAEFEKLDFEKREE